MQIRLTLLLTILCISILPTQQFYIYLTQSSAQCYYSTIYREERLLIEVETPIISLAHKIFIRVKNGNDTLLERDIINKAKITVPRISNTILNTPNTENITYLEHEVCFSVVVDQSTMQMSNDSQTKREDPVIMKKGYILGVKILTNFQHKLEAKRTEPKDVNYQQIQTVAQRLLQINIAQINLHQVNEVKEKLSQVFLQTLKQKIILYSVLQISMIVLFTVVQIQMLKQYLNSISII